MPHDPKGPDLSRVIPMRAPCDTRPAECAGAPEAPRDPAVYYRTDPDDRYGTDNPDGTPRSPRLADRLGYRHYEYVREDGARIHARAKHGSSPWFPPTIRSVVELRPVPGVDWLVSCQPGEQPHPMFWQTIEAPLVRPWTEAGRPYAPDATPQAAIDASGSGEPD